MRDVETSVLPPQNEAEDANSKLALTRRTAQSQLSWAGPWLVVTGRSVLMIAAQALVALIRWLMTHTWSWDGAAKWWTVYGTLVDIGCLMLMAAFVRKEGIRLRDLIGRVRLRWGRDLFLGLGCYLLIFPFFGVAFPAASRLVYGAPRLPMYAGTLMERALPLWAVIYSFSVWWLIWSPTEEMTYQGYALPRFEVLCKNRWMAVGIVGFWWALQHSFFPFILDWRYVAWRFLAFLPGVVVSTLVYLRLRRLPPLILAHWPMDIVAVFYTLKF